MRVLFLGADSFSALSFKSFLRHSRQIELPISTIDVLTNQPGSELERTAKIEGSKVINCPARSLSINNNFDFDWKAYSLGIVSSFGLFIPHRIINQIPLINIHPSLLPKWRGPAPIQFTILNGEKITGVSIIDLHPKVMDAGSIILRETFEISNLSNVTYKTLEESLAEIGGRLAAVTINNFTNYWKNKTNQASYLEEVSHSRKITKADGIISFKINTFEEISFKVRALSHQIPIRSIDLFHSRSNEQRQVFLEDFEFNFDSNLNLNLNSNSNSDSKLNFYSLVPDHFDIWYDRNLKAVLFRIASNNGSFKTIGVRRFKIEGKSQIYSAGSFYSNYLKTELNNKCTTR